MKKQHLLHSTRFTHATLVAAAFLLFAAAFAHASDWPRLRGPNLDGISTETDWLSAWPASGPKKLWRKSVGEGYGSMAVADGQVFASGLDRRSRRETLYCLDAETGAEKWKYPYPTRFKPQFYEGGTSGTPTVDGDTVYFLEQTARLFAIDVASGKLKWGAEIDKLTGSELGMWGLTGSPLVMGDLLILNVGASGAAVNKETGKLAWKSRSAKNGYATPVPFKQNGKALVAIFSSGGLAAVDPMTGKGAWQHRWKTQYDVNAADPVLIDDKRIFISSGYGSGSAMLELTGAGVKVAWQSKELRTQFNPAVYLNGHLFGIDGDTASNRATLTCLDPRTGKSKWRSPSLGSGGALMAANGKLIVAGAQGGLMVVPATGDGFKAESQAQVMGGKNWTAPVLANGRIYCRNSRGDLLCLDVKVK